jgi:hypothetical protein
MRAWPALWLLAAACARAADADDEAALRLADKAVMPEERRGDWRGFVEAARGETLTSGAATPARVDRLSIDAAYDGRIAPGWRVVFDDRLDARWPDRLASQENVNTLKDAYVSWQAGPDRIADLGRINTRYGAAYAYNPTDYFRAGAVRSIVSVDPASARENRMGSVMARVQRLWTSGSLTALYSPQLEEHPSDDAFSLDLGATNRRDRWQLVASHRFSPELSPQWILHGAAGEAPQAGLNLSALVNDATVAYVEASAGRSSSLRAVALGEPEDRAWRSRLSAGFTWTSATKLSITLEYEYDGAALDAAGWDALRRGPAADYGRYRALVANLQELPTKQRLFARASWQDALVSHLDLSINSFFNPIDASRQHGLEARYHWKRVDAAVQWQVRGGAALSEFGGLAGQHSWQALVAWFL